MRVFNYDVVMWKYDNMLVMHSKYRSSFSLLMEAINENRCRVSFDRVNTVKNKEVLYKLKALEAKHETPIPTLDMVAEFFHQLPRLLIIM